MLVITEVVYLLATRLGVDAEVRFLGDLASGNLIPEPVASAERLAITEVATLDPTALQRRPSNEWTAESAALTGADRPDARFGAPRLLEVDRSSAPLLCDQDWHFRASPHSEWLERCGAVSPANAMASCLVLSRP